MKKIVLLLMLSGLVLTSCKDKKDVKTLEAKEYKVEKGE